MQQYEHILLNTIIETINDGIIVLDKNINIIKINSLALKFFNLNSPRNIEGKSSKFLINQCEQLLEFIIKTVKYREHINFENKFTCFNGTKLERSIYIQATSLTDKNNHFLGILLIIKQLEQETIQNDDIIPDLCGIVGSSKKIRLVFDIIKRLAQIDSNVLIIGETGTGKELIAEAIHNLSNRHNKPLIKLNCSAITESLFESELFGSVKGAFTGAYKDKKGIIEQADGGTLFLDEIGDLPLHLQVKLLRFLQEREFEKVGETKTRKVDVRVIAATNKNLNDLVEEGKFRRDFYHRLNVFKITVPPLRDRREDIEPLTDYFLSFYNKKFKRNIKFLSDKVKDFFYSYYWPGNVRELKHLLEYAVIMSPGNIIIPESLPDDLYGYFKKQIPESEKKVDISSEKERIIDALIKAKWHKSKAAKILGISRRTLYRKLKKFNIS